MTVHDDTSLGVLQFFNSHPHKEDDQPIDGRKSFYNFSTHILTRRMTLSRRSIKSCKTFQLTSSQGGWHLLYRFYPVAFLFNSHPHKEDDVNVMLLNAHSVFQLTSSQGGWLYTMTPVWVSCNFSTHILTRRMTSLSTEGNHSITFQLTSSQGGWLGSANCSFFAVLFQLTSSQGGWLDIQSSEQTGNDFSTHILTRRMTHFVANNLWKIIFSTHILTRRMTYFPLDCFITYPFQLTSSQGGWLTTWNDV